MDQIEAEARQPEVDRLQQVAVLQFVTDKQIAEQADALPGEHRVYRMQLLAKVQMLHFAGIRYVPPSASGGAQPPLPSRRARDERWPVKVDENMTAKIRRLPKRTLGPK